MYELKTGPAQEPVSVSDLKEYLRIDHSDEDDLIESLGKSARVWVENHITQYLITQTWVLWLDFFPIQYKDSNAKWWDGIVDGSISTLFQQQNYIPIERGPVQSITHLKTYDTEDTATTFSSDYYILNQYDRPAKIVLRQSQIWPTTNLRSSKGIEIEFVSGFGSTGTSVPESINQSIKHLTLELYEKRGDEFKVPQSVFLLLEPYRRKKLA